MIAKQFIKSTLISAYPNWLRSIDKRVNTIQSLSASSRDWIIQSTASMACTKSLHQCGDILQLGIRQKGNYLTQSYDKKP